MTNTVLSVANTFLSLGQRDGFPISNMKLQKLLYFAQGHSLGMRERPLMNELPEAWRFGPVFPSAYNAFKHFGADNITEPGRLFDPNTRQFYPAPEVYGDDRLFVEAVWNAYKDRSPLQLSEMSHVADGPWHRAYGNGQYWNADIGAQEMAQYFAPRAPA